MDSGVNTDKTFTVEERIESGTFPDDSNFSDKEIIGVMDAIFASQVNNKDIIQIQLLKTPLTY